ncbi:MAG: SPOR domain-containing protein [Bacteroidetes bacterium]|nr:SPOR domain-containing protein [Bacteroidota bacterium]
MCKNLRCSLFVLVLVCLAGLLHVRAQTAPVQTDTTAKAKRPEPAPFVFKPTLGLGVGMFSFYGDLYKRNLVNPQVSRIGYELSLSQPLTPWLRLGFYTLFGKLGANERLITRNLNFESEIRVGGMHFEYNFGHFIKPNKMIHPWVNIGFESFEFLSKTDLYDAQGRRYFYWNDGSIRSLDQTDPNAANALFLQRDYVYETDVRELNLDGFGKYPERSFAVPVGAGFLMHLDEKWDARLGVTFHFTRTDYIDGVTPQSQTPRTGNARNDHYVMTAFSLRYNLTGPAETVDENGNDAFSDVDYYALDNSDYDGDGVIDLKDSCEGTPPGVAVNEKGCPLDGDGDYTADYRDKELESARGVVTDEYGITLTDSLILRRYQMYMDSTGMFAVTEVIRSSDQYKATASDKKVYQVMLGNYTSGVPNELLVKYLSITDIGSNLQPDSTTTYTAGKYNDVLSAEKRRRALVQQGYTDAKVVYRKPDGSFQVVDNVFVYNQQQTSKPADSLLTVQNTVSNPVTNPVTNPQLPIDSMRMAETDPVTGQLVFRVQLGAFKQPLSPGVFNDVPDLVMVRTSDGLYKYMTGSFSTFEQAAERKAQMLVKGYKGAFIAAYKDGKRVPLTQAGATVVKSNTPAQPENLSESTAPSPDMKQLVTYKVQLGVFRNEPPAEIKEKLSTLTGVETSTTPNGFVRYTIGRTASYEQIIALRNELKAKGFDDAFVIAFFQDQPVPVSEALELQK